MLYNETDRELIIKYKGKWSMDHKIVAPSWKDLFLATFGKITGNPRPIHYIEENKDNALMDEGEQDILELFFRNNSLLGSPFYFGLGNNGGSPGIPAETSTLASITETSGTGYGRIQVARGTSDFGAATLDSGDYMTTTTTKQFSAGGTWTYADYLFLCDVSSGTSGDLLATVALSATRSLLTGDKLDVSMKIKLQ